MRCVLPSRTGAVPATVRGAQRPAAPLLLLLVSVTGVLAAGCFADDQNAQKDGVAPQTTLVRYLRSGDDAQTEASLATAPGHPGRVLVAWLAGRGELADVATAVSTDGGANWTLRSLEPPLPPGSQAPAADHWYSDPVAQFLPDGTPVVLFMGPMTEVARDETPIPFGLPVAYRLTLARSEDDGATWTYHTIAEYAAGARFVDYPDLAVAPDSGTLSVVSNVFAGVVNEGVYIWQSEDGGRTWDEPRKTVAPPEGTSMAYARGAAGPDGLVVVTAAKSLGENAWAPVCAVSTDGGQTFREPVDLAPDLQAMTLETRPAVWSNTGGTASIGVLISNEDGLHLARSADGGATWSEPVHVSQVEPGTRHVWGALAASPNGTLHALHRYGASDPPMFVVELYRSDVEGRTTMLWQSREERAGGPIAGDDYGGLAVAADGTIWAAWSEPGQAGAREIAVGNFLWNSQPS